MSYLKPYLDALRVNDLSHGSDEYLLRVSSDRIRLAAHLTDAVFHEHHNGAYFTGVDWSKVPPRQGKRIRIEYTHPHGQHNGDCHGKALAAAEKSAEWHRVAGRVVSVEMFDRTCASEVEERAFLTRVAVMLDALDSPSHDLASRELLRLQTF